VLWITWEVQRRNRTLSRRFGAELHEILAKGSRFGRYISCAARTVDVIRRRRPDVLIVQSPSVFLGLIAVTVGRLWCARIVIDAHNAGVFPLEGRSAFLNWVCRSILKSSDIAFVSNDELQSKLGLENVQVLPDPLPGLLETGAADSGAAPAGSEDSSRAGEFRATYITSWAADEPYEAVMESAGLLPDGFQIRITGRVPTEVLRRGPLPSALHLLGYLDEATYVAELRSADLILVLTTRESCLTCGAYEAVSLRKPLLLSRTKALEDYFGTAASYIENCAVEISRAILESRPRIGEMQRNAVQASERLESAWEQKFFKIKAIVFGPE